MGAIVVTLGLLSRYYAKPNNTTSSSMKIPKPAATPTQRPVSEEIQITEPQVDKAFLRETTLPDETVRTYQKEGHLVVRGNTSRVECMETHTHQFSVRCCSDTKPAISICSEGTQYYSGLESGFVEVTGVSDANLKQTREICARYGRRLCSVRELQTVAANTGCNSNNEGRLNISNEKCMM